MNGSKDAPQQASPKAPPETFWFGLHRRNSGGAWVRCERPEWGNMSKWWPIAEADPLAMATRAFGPGIYRALWRGEDRRKHKGYSDPFVIHPAEGETMPDAMPATPSSQAGAPTATALGGLAPLLSADPTGPLAQFMILLSMVREESEHRHTRMMREHELSLARLHAETEMRVQNMQTTHQLMSQGQSELAQAIERAKNREHDLPIVQALQQLDGQVKALALHQADELDDDRDGLATLSDNPTDLERVMTGFQNVISTLMSSPGGRVIAEAIARKISGGRVPTVPLRDAAE